MLLLLQVPDLSRWHRSIIIVFGSQMTGNRAFQCSASILKLHSQILCSSFNTEQNLWVWFGASDLNLISYGFPNLTCKKSGERHTQKILLFSLQICWKPKTNAIDDCPWRVAGALNTNEKWNEEIRGGKKYMQKQNKDRGPWQSSSPILLMMRYFDRKHQTMHSNYGLVPHSLHCWIKHSLTHAHTYSTNYNNINCIPLWKKEEENRAKTLLFVQGIGRIGILN